MLFLSMFKTLVGKKIVVELKNDLQVEGRLHSSDQYLNLKLDECRVVNSDRFPQLAAVTSMFVRGSVVRYVHLPAEEIDTELLHDASRKEASGR